jgi:hypothetical protein
MRKHSVDLPDPDKFGAVIPKSLNKGSSTFGDATAACKPLQVPKPSSVELAQRPKMTSAEIKLLFAYSKCMQTHGLPSFPDPDPDGYSTEAQDKTIEALQSSSGYQKAAKVCDPMIPRPKFTGTPQG